MNLFAVSGSHTYPQVVGSCFYLKSFYYYYRVDGGQELHLTEFTKEDIRIFKHDTDDVAIYYKEANLLATFVGDRKSVVPKQEADIFIDSRETKSFGDCSVSVESRFPDPNVYLFKTANELTPCTFATSWFLLAVIDCFYFFYDYSVHEVVKLNKDFNEVARKSFKSTWTKFSQLDNLLFIYTRSGTHGDVAVFDLERFDSIAALPSEAKSVSIVVQPERVDDSVLFSCGDKSYCWDGNALRETFTDKPVAAYVGKSNFYYIAFKNDPNIYAYDSNLDRTVGKKISASVGFMPARIAAVNDLNCAIFRPVGSREIGGLTYFATWKDDELFSELDIDCLLEPLIYSEEKIYVGEYFFVKIAMQGCDEYGTLARQMMAAVDDAMFKYAFTGEQNIYSDKFLGKIEVDVEKSELLSSRQQKELKDACKEVFRFYMYATSKVTGKACSLKMNFI
ncbi:hypothetical protein [Simiduia agarivorans]|uniref:Uncharacterized protein n=1 Tax=Simiduia agarivorans (strain DSM 21679 / JCM 13881 / BCRC 17597 / SA1) TaxID=1117647 RepID=K4KH79_SIMAS|nr:hypothetical protein [Simiduia agarivorans]AFU97298.1 hypothetical protein M5M_00305 [Simiduia agarivorans SA1 = DSM 21679]